MTGIDRKGYTSPVVLYSYLLVNALIGFILGNKGNYFNMEKLILANIATYKIAILSDIS